MAKSYLNKLGSALNHSRRGGVRINAIREVTRKPRDGKRNGGGKGNRNERQSGEKKGVRAGGTKKGKKGSDTDKGGEGEALELISGLYFCARLYVHG